MYLILLVSIFISSAFGEPEMVKIDGKYYRYRHDNIYTINGKRIYYKVNPREAARNSSSAGGAVSVSGQSLGGAPSAEGKSPTEKPSTIEIDDEPEEGGEDETD